MDLPCVVWRNQQPSNSHPHLLAVTFIHTCLKALVCLYVFPVISLEETLALQHTQADYKTYSLVQALQNYSTPLVVILSPRISVSDDVNAVVRNVSYGVA